MRCCGLLASIQPVYRSSAGPPAGYIPDSGVSAVGRRLKTPISSLSSNNPGRQQSLYSSRVSGNNWCRADFVGASVSNRTYAIKKSNLQTHGDRSMICPKRMPMRYPSVTVGTMNVTAKPLTLGLQGVRGN
jgi:hypothetical protein